METSQLFFLLSPDEETLNPVFGSETPILGAVDFGALGPRNPHRSHCRRREKAFPRTSDVTFCARNSLPEKHYFCPPAGGLKGLLRGSPGGRAMPYRRLMEDRRARGGVWARARDEFYGSEGRAGGPSHPWWRSWSNGDCGSRGRTGSPARARAGDGFYDR